MLTSFNQIIRFELSSAILHLAKINLILTFNLWQNIVFFHIFICASLSVQTSIWLKNLHLHVTPYSIQSTICCPISGQTSSWSFPISARPWEQRAFGLVSHSLTIIPFIVGSGHRAHLITGLP